MLERDPKTGSYSPRLGVGYGYHLYKGTFDEHPALTWAGAGGGVEVAYAPINEGVEVAAEARVVLPLMFVAGLGPATRLGWRWDPHRDGESFFELGVSFIPLQGVRIPSDYCNPMESDPDQPNSIRHCPDSVTQPSDVIHGDWLGFIDVYPYRDWDDEGDIQTYGGVRWVFGVEGPSGPKTPVPSR